MCCKFVLFNGFTDLFKFLCCSKLVWLFIEVAILATKSKCTFLLCWVKSEMPMPVCQTAWWNIPDDVILIFATVVPSFYSKVVWSCRTFITEFSFSQFLHVILVRFISRTVLAYCWNFQTLLCLLCVVFWLSGMGLDCLLLLYGSRLPIVIHPDIIKILLSLIFCSIVLKGF